ncbi:fimbrial protein [Serratia fonticola]|uniref:fimbrial protein n=1 Tax=Serratia fonticola TaxID=47917 RepID=UPI003AB00296
MQRKSQEGSGYEGHRPQWLYALAVTVLVLSGQQAQAANTTVKVTVTIAAPPPCEINGNNLIEVKFGNDVMTTRINGSYKKQLVPYTIECKNAQPNEQLKIQIVGNQGAGFNSHVLQTEKDGLGIALLRNDNPQPLNTWVSFTYPNKPKFEVVPVKLSGAILKGGRFSAGATMKVEYQ